MSIAGTEQDTTMTLTADPPSPHAMAPTWVRLAAVALAVPNVFAGIWAIASPRGWFNSFPGFGPDLVAAEPPFNAHLATDAGAGLFAAGLVLVLVAWLGDTRSIRIGVLAHAAFVIPHTAYHVFNPSPGLSTAEDFQNAGSLAFAAVAAMALFVFAGRPTRATARS